VDYLNNLYLKCDCAKTCVLKRKTGLIKVYSIIVCGLLGLTNKCMFQVHEYQSNIVIVPLMGPSRRKYLAHIEFL